MNHGKKTAAGLGFGESIFVRSRGVVQGVEVGEKGITRENFTNTDFTTATTAAKDDLRNDSFDWNRHRSRLRCWYGDWGARRSPSLGQCIPHFVGTDKSFRSGGGD